MAGTNHIETQKNDSDKCEVVFWEGKLGQDCSVKGKALGRVTEQRDLGAQEDSSPKVVTQVDGVVKKEITCLSSLSTQVGILCHNCTCHWWDHTRNIVYISGRPVYRKYVIELEWVQKRFRRMLLGLKGLSY